MGCKASKETVAKVSPATQEQFDDSVKSDKEASSNQTAIVPSKKAGNKPVSEEEAIKRSQERLGKQALPAIPSKKGGVAFDIILDENEAPKSGKLVLPKLEATKKSASQEFHMVDVVNNDGDNRIRQKTKITLTSAKDTSSEALRQRLLEKEQQAAENRQRELEKLQEKLAKQEERAKTVQERKKNRVSWDENSGEPVPDQDSGVGASKSGSKLQLSHENSQTVAAI